MTTPTENQKTSGLSNKVVIIAAAVVVAVVIIATVILLSGRDDSSDGGIIGYATEATVMLDQASLQAAMDEAMRNAQDSSVALKYKNDAISKNGIDFDCYIANSELNVYDMFLTIFADAELTDQIFLSKLVRPGSGFESITLDHALETGDHTVYVAVTQVENDEESGEQVIKNQVMHTMDFHVVE